MFFFPGHFSIGLLTSELTNLNALLLVIGNMLPDMDVIPYFFGSDYRKTHRALTHSFAFIIIMSLFSPMIGLGVAMHVLIDGLTYPGVKLFSPFSDKPYYFYKGNFAKPNSLKEFLVDSLHNKKRMALEFGLLFISLSIL